jgi:hypothetical protein
LKATFVDGNLWLGERLINVAELAQLTWERAARDDAVSSAWLLCVLDSAGTVAGRDVEGSNVRKHVVRELVELDAVAAGLAVRIAGEVGWRPYEFLGVIAADGRDDVGLIAPITRDAEGQPTVGPPTDWHGRRPAPFEKDFWQFVEFRGALLGTLRHGLRRSGARSRRGA